MSEQRAIDAALANPQHAFVPSAGRTAMHVADRHVERWAPEAGAHRVRSLRVARRSSIAALAPLFASRAAVDRAVRQRLGRSASNGAAGVVGVPAAVVPGRARLDGGRACGRQRSGRVAGASCSRRAARTCAPRSRIAAGDADRAARVRRAVAVARAAARRRDAGASSRHATCVLAARAVRGQPRRRGDGARDRAARRRRPLRDADEPEPARRDVDGDRIAPPRRARSRWMPRRRAFRSPRPSS